jgi:hypothetical protein
LWLSFHGCLLFCIRRGTKDLPLDYEISAEMLTPNAGAQWRGYESAAALGWVVPCDDTLPL